MAPEPSQAARTAAADRMVRRDRRRPLASLGEGWHDLGPVAAMLRLHGAKVSLEDAAPGLAVVVEFDASCGARAAAVSAGVPGRESARVR